jgi:DNA-binding NtrC family response regulator
VEGRSWSSSTNNGLPKILIVDDEGPIREILSALLTAANYHCQVCGSGGHALRMLEQYGPFELVLYDLKTTDLDGVALAKYVSKEHPDTSVVMVTAIHDVSVALTPSAAVPMTIY